MWPFSKKSTAPEPRLSMVVACSATELPPLVQVAHPSGQAGAVKGMAGPADQNLTPERLLQPMTAGGYLAAAPGGGTCVCQVEHVAGVQAANPISFPPELWPILGLQEDMLQKFNQPTWRIVIQLAQPGENVPQAVLFATRLAQRLAELGDGVVFDASAGRFFGPTGWPVEDPVGEVDCREHVQLHMETDGDAAGRWCHTHGLIKFGKPELEIYDVPPELVELSAAVLLQTTQYVIDSAMIKPTETLGDPDQPFYAREGTRNRSEHWEDIPVLELVDVDDRRKPVPSGAPKALQAFAAAQASDGQA